MMSNYDFVKRKGEKFLMGHEGACTYLSFHFWNTETRMEGRFVDKNIQDWFVLPKLLISVYTWSHSVCWTVNIVTVAMSNYLKTLSVALWLCISLICCIIQITLLSRNHSLACLEHRLTDITLQNHKWIKEQTFCQSATFSFGNSS
jgi:hypothetical protein